MKLLNTVTDYFMSPITGRLASSTLLPYLLEDYVWEGNLVNAPYPSPVLIDMRLTTAQLQNQVDEIAATKFIIKTASTYVPNSQALDALSTGVMVNTGGVISTSDDYVKNTESSVVVGNIAIFADSSGKLIADSGGSIPDITEYVREAQQAATDAQNSALDASISAGKALGSAEEASVAAAAAGAFKSEAETAASTATTEAAAALASAGAAAASATVAVEYAGVASDQASQAHDSAVAAFNSKTDAATSETNAANSASASASSAAAAAASATSASVSEAQCEDILLELRSTGINLTGDIVGFGPIDYPIVTTLDLTLDRIPLATSNVNLNLQKIVNLANGTNPNDAVNYSQLTGMPGSIVVNQNTSSVTMVAGRSYYINNGASLVTLTLPATAAQGDTFIIRGGSSGGWKVAQNSGQTINMDGTPTTTGTGGNLSSTGQYQCITISCIIANTTFIVCDSIGSITVT